jgi:hypothetical protein
MNNTEELNLNIFLSFLGSTSKLFGNKGIYFRIINSLSIYSNIWKTNALFFFSLLVKSFIP